MVIISYHPFSFFYVIGRNVIKNKIEIVVHEPNSRIFRRPQRLFTPAYRCRLHLSLLLFHSAPLSFSVALAFSYFVSFCLNALEHVLSLETFDLFPRLVPWSVERRSVASVYVRWRDRSVDPRERLALRTVFSFFSFSLLSPSNSLSFFSFDAADAVFSLIPTRFRSSLQFSTDILYMTHPLLRSRIVWTG